MNISKVFISIIIPTYNDLERLCKCLKALEQQTLPRSQYEIIVVDNNSTDGTSASLKERKDILLLREFKQTSYAARNTGILAAKGDILAFTDSDCIPVESWLENGIAQLFAVPNCGFVGGDIKLFFRNPKQLTPVEIYETVTAMPQKDYVEKQKFAATANMFTFKSVVDEVGMFDSNLSSRGDYEWGRRVHKAGYSTSFSDKAQVLHPSRHSLSQIKMKSSRVLSGIYDLKKKNDELSSYELLKDLFLGLRPPVKKTIKLASDEKIIRFEDKISLVYVVFLLHYNKILVTFKVFLKHSLNR